MRLVIKFLLLCQVLECIRTQPLIYNKTKSNLDALLPLPKAATHLKCIFDYFRDQKLQEFRDILLITSVNLPDPIEELILTYLIESLGAKIMIMTYKVAGLNQISNDRLFTTVLLADDFELNRDEVEQTISRLSKKMFTIHANDFLGRKIELFNGPLMRSMNEVSAITLSGCGQKTSPSCKCDIFETTNGKCATRPPNKCRLVVRAHEFEPCTIMNKKHALTNSIEAILLPVFERKLNMKILISQSKKLAKQTDIFIGGLTGIHANKTTALTATTSYDYDSYTWCVTGANVRPKWQNIFAICKSINVVYLGFTFYYVIVYLMFAEGFFQRWTYDSYTMMLSSLRFVINTSQRDIFTSWSTRMMIIVPMWGMVLFYNIVVAFYILIIHRDIGTYQISTQSELVEQRHQLAGNLRTLEVIKEIEMVSVYCYAFISRSLYYVEGGAGG